MQDLIPALHLSAPEGTLAIGGLVLLMLGAFMGEKSARLVSILSVALLVAATAVTVTGPLGQAFNGAYVADPLAVYGKAIIFLSSAVCIVLGGGWMQRAKIARFEYPILIVLASAGMGMMASSGDLISMYVGIELHSLALYVLAAFHRDDLKASEAGLKYFVLGALSSGLLLYGASLVYGFTGSMNFQEIAAYAAQNPSVGLVFGLVFVICGLAFKISAAPFHMWTPDVYEGAPTPVVALFATAPKMAAMVLVARVLIDGFAGSHDQWAQVLVLMWGTGANGKSTLDEVIRFILGDYAKTIAFASLLREWDPATKEYTGRQVEKKVTYARVFKIDQLFWTEAEIKEKMSNRVVFKMLWRSIFLWWHLR